MVYDLEAVDISFENCHRYVGSKRCSQRGQTRAEQPSSRSHSGHRFDLMFFAFSKSISRSNATCSRPSLVLGRTAQNAIAIGPRNIPITIPSIGGYPFFAKIQPPTYPSNSQRAILGSSMNSFLTIDHARDWKMLRKLVLTSNSRKTHQRTLKWAEDESKALSQTEYHRCPKQKAVAARSIPSTVKNCRLGFSNRGLDSG